MNKITRLITSSYGLKILIVLAVVALFSDLTFAASGASDGHSAGHTSPITPVLVSLITVLLAAKIGGDLFVRIGQPEVLGEIVVGLLLGNLSHFGINTFEYIKHDQILEILSELGVIILLFEVGLETNLKEMTKVGTSALIVAILGVVAPMALGYAVACYFLPNVGVLPHIFVGATLAATSVGITARVLKDLGKVSTKEAKIILGAAVIDDVLGLIVLAVVMGVISAANAGTSLEMFEIAKIFGLAVGFLVVAVLLGRYVSPLCFKIASNLRSHGLLLVTSLLICFGLSYAASAVGLATIVGAFTAGLILEPVHYRDLSLKYQDADIETLIHPLATLFVPIFFVVMGSRVDLSVFADSSILGFAVALTLAAIIGKQLCSLGVLEKGLDKILVGVGMIPRGEVGLIFVGIGASLTLNGEPVIDKATFGAVVIMVILTTMITPPLIKWRYSRKPEGNPEQINRKSVD